jgi:predicted SprT family Zn-dependent metalloprotease
MKGRTMQASIYYDHTTKQWRSVRSQQIVYVCKCGEVFTKPYRLREHIGLQNPHWPRSSEQDEHGVNY